MGDKEERDKQTGRLQMKLIEQDKYVLLADDKHYVLWCKYYT